MKSYYDLLVQKIAANIAQTPDKTAYRINGKATTFAEMDQMASSISRADTFPLKSLVLRLISADILSNLLKPFFSVNCNLWRECIITKWKLAPNDLHSVMRKT